VTIEIIRESQRFSPDAKYIPFYLSFVTQKPIICKGGKTSILVLSV